MLGSESSGSQSNYQALSLIFNFVPQFAYPKPTTLVFTPFTAMDNYSKSGLPPDAAEAEQAFDRKGVSAQRGRLSFAQAIALDWAWEVAGGPGKEDPFKEDWAAWAECIKPLVQA